MGNPAKEMKNIELLDADIQMIEMNPLYKLTASERDIKDPNPEGVDDILKKYEIYEKVLKG